MRKWALQNAVKYGGKANTGSVIGKILSEKPELRNELKSLTKDIKKVIKAVDSLSLEKQKEELEKIAPGILEEKKGGKKGLKPLQNVKGKVIMRFAPSASGALHIGHAFVLSLNSEYCKMYNGKFILRIEDTNPENIYEPAYKLLEEDTKWLTKEDSVEVVIQSDRLGIYYDHAEILISLGHAYVCICNPDTFRDYMMNKKACPCRNLSKKEQLERWDKMFSSYKPGEAVVRIKTDVNHKNPAMRDWPALRINEHPHPRTKKEHRVWPLMNFSVAVDDHISKTTHTIRGKDHIDNEKRQRYIYDYLGWEVPTHLYIGRINFLGLELSSTETKKRIEYKEYTSWEDIRLPFIPALRRRGYQPEAFIRYAVDMGVTLSDKTVSKEEFFKNLEAYNREAIEPLANRYFFVEDPVEINVEGTPEIKAELPLHPDHPERGKRIFRVDGKFYISKDDFKKLKNNKLYRLMDCLNFVKENKNFVYDSKDYERYKENGEFIMHWLPDKMIIPVEVLMPDGSIKKGIGEDSMRQLKEGDIVQLERFAFCRLDKKGKKFVFWYTHK